MKVELEPKVGIVLCKIKAKKKKGSVVMLIIPLLYYPSFTDLVTTEF